LAIAVDSVLGGEPLPGFLGTLLPASAYSSNAVLVFAVALLVGLALLGRLRSLASSLLRTYTGEMLLLDFRGKLFRHAQRLSLAYHDTKGTADSLYRIQWDAGPVRYVAIDGVTPFITATFTLVSMLFITFRIDWQLALIALAVSPFLFMATRAYRGPLRRQSRQLKKLESAAVSVVQEVLGSLRVVKAFGQEDREQERDLSIAPVRACAPACATRWLRVAWESCWE
jgi:ATP-binding cassette subfamily B protein